MQKQADVIIAGISASVKLENMPGFIPVGQRHSVGDGVEIIGYLGGIRIIRAPHMQDDLMIGLNRGLTFGEYQL